ncbi:MAG: carbohydrate-binding family 9-like protein, partial [Spirochaetota bacterium]
LNLPFPYKDAAAPISPYNLAGLKSAVSIQGKLNDPASMDESWCVEVAIPWESLKSFHRNGYACPKLGEYWRVNFSRVEWDVACRESEIYKIPNRPEYNWVWSAQGVIDMHRPERWGFAYFLEAGMEAPKKLPPVEILKERAMEMYYWQKHFADSREGSRGAFLSKEALIPHLSSECAAALRELTLTSGHYLAHFHDHDNALDLFITDKSQVIF